MKNKNHNLEAIQVPGMGGFLLSLNRPTPSIIKSNGGKIWIN